MAVRIEITRPAPQLPFCRTFTNRREAAKFGVAYYLRDNGYASAAQASATAAEYQRTGVAHHGSYAFHEIGQRVAGTTRTV